MGKFGCMNREIQIFEIEILRDGEFNSEKHSSGGIKKYK
jgi:hypothetical protein